MSSPSFDSLNGIQNQIAVINSEAEIVFVNESWKEYGEERGGSGEYMYTDYIECCVETEAGEAVSNRINELLDGEDDEFTMEYAGHGPIERDWYRVHGTTLDCDGERYVILEHVNINKEKTLEQEVKQLDSFISSHLAHMNHEIRNKATIILGQIEMLESQIAQSHPEVIDNHSKPIIRAGNKITSVLDSNRPESPLFKDTNLKELSLEDVIWTVWKDLPTNGYTLVVNVDKDVVADMVQLEHLIENLFLTVLNQHHSSQKKIIVGETETGFYIQSTGEDFEDTSLFNFDERTLRSELGYGLHIIKRIVQNHDWAITAENTDAGGRITVSDVRTLREEIESHSD